MWFIVPAAVLFILFFIDKDFVCKVQFISIVVLPFSCLVICYCFSSKKNKHIKYLILHCLFSPSNICFQLALAISVYFLVLFFACRSGLFGLILCFFCASFSRYIIWYVKDRYHCNFWSSEEKNLFSPIEHTRWVFARYINPVAPTIVQLCVCQSQTCNNYFLV